jgi:hypothetical protein
MASIATVTLPIGNGYIVGGQNTESNFERLACGSANNTLCGAAMSQSTEPRIRYSAAMFSSLGTVLTRPTGVSSATQGFYGPSFSISAVPEPTFAVLLIGLACASLTRPAREVKGAERLVR